jgi:superfamily I DNA and/or RNA helicase
MIRERSRTEPEYRALADLEEKLRKVEVPSGKLCNEYRKVLKKAELKLLQSTKFDIIFCTCNEASGVRVRKNTSPRQCIIDECGMAHEPETIVPISLCEHAVLIGDHMQLQPVINYRPAKENGLATSLFERYALYYEDRYNEDQDRDYVITLKTQYRMVKVACNTHSISS